jgi:hypothetical protein
LLDTPERQKLATDLLNQQLPRLAAELENQLYDQGARVSFQAKLVRKSPRINVVVKLKKQDHQVLIHLDSKQALCKVGSQSGLGGMPAENAESACRIAKNLMLRVRTA